MLLICVLLAQVCAKLWFDLKCLKNLLYTRPEELPCRVTCHQARPKLFPNSPVPENRILIKYLAKMGKGNSRIWTIIPGLQFGFHLCLKGNTIFGHRHEMTLSNVNRRTAPNTRQQGLTRHSGSRNGWDSKVYRTNMYKPNQTNTKSSISRQLVRSTHACFLRHTFVPYVNTDL